MLAHCQPCSSLKTAQCFFCPAVEMKGRFTTNRYDFLVRRTSWRRDDTQLVVVEIESKCLYMWLLSGSERVRLVVATSQNTAQEAPMQPSLGHGM